MTMDLLRSLLPPEGWQPAATAPRDGTPFLCWEDGVMGVCYWGNPGISTLSGAPMKDAWICVLICGPVMERSEGVETLVSCLGSDFTHWMMLPSGPE